MWWNWTSTKDWPRNIRSQWLHHLDTIWGRRSLGHYDSCFHESDGPLNYQDSFGKLNEFPLADTNRVFHVNKVKYQSIFANNCGYLVLLHLYTHDAVDPAIQKVWGGPQFTLGDGTPCVLRHHPNCTLRTSNTLRNKNRFRYRIYRDRFLRLQDSHDHHRWYKEVPRIRSLVTVQWEVWDKQEVFWLHTKLSNSRVALKASRKDWRLEFQSSVRGGSKCDKKRRAEFWPPVSSWIPSHKWNISHVIQYIPTPDFNGTNKGYIVCKELFMFASCGQILTLPAMSTRSSHDSVSRTMTTLGKRLKNSRTVVYLIKMSNSGSTFCPTRAMTILFISNPNFVIWAMKLRWWMNWKKRDYKSYIVLTIYPMVACSDLRRMSRSRIFERNMEVQQSVDTISPYLWRNGWIIIRKSWHRFDSRWNRFALIQYGELIWTIWTSSKGSPK